MNELREFVMKALYSHGETLPEVPDDVLESITGTLGALYVDLRGELERRKMTGGAAGMDITREQREIRYGAVLSPENERLAAELGVRYATRCVCQHVVVYSAQAIPEPVILPCCEADGECPDCPAPEGYEHAVEIHE